VLVIARQQARSETFRVPGIAVEVSRFSAGPTKGWRQSTSAASTMGAVGDSHRSSRVGGCAIVYAAGQPITNARGTLVPAIPDFAASRILKGRRVGFTGLQRP